MTESPLLQSAEAPTASRWQRLERRIFGQRPLNTAVWAAQSADNPRVFTPTEEGSGNFGRWIIDEHGLPAYQYEMDHLTDPRALYPNSEELERRDHWHQVGNHRVTAMASNDGTVQVYLGDRGGVFLNRFEAWEFERPGFQLRTFIYQIARWIVQQVTRLFRSNSPVTPFAQSQTAAEHLPPRGAITPEIQAQIAAQQVSAQSTAQTVKRRDPAATPHAYSGGFSYIYDGSETWATAYRYRPAQAETQRVFGVGYAEYTTTYRHIRVKRRVYAPYGDAPAIVSDVEIENLGVSAVDLSHYEYWDVNVHQLRLEWLRGGSFAVSSDRARRDVNRFFTPRIDWHTDHAALRFEQRVRQPAPPEYKAPELSSDIDWCPSDIFLADLSGTPDAYHVSKQAFFGSSGVMQPDEIRDRHASSTIPNNTDDPMPYCMVLRRDLHLKPGERRTLRYAYGTARPEASLDFLNTLRTEQFAQTLAHWQDNLVYFSTGEDPVLQREMAWHTYNMASAAVYADYHKTHIIPQGSAYLFLHGADGAPRDQALFTLPMTYVNPDIARDMLRLIMRITDVHTGQITYSFAGHGHISDGLGIHSTPSDLDLFFLLGLGEYLAATGDHAFLDEEIPFYPPEAPQPNNTVLDHVRVAVRHLFEGTGIGEHGLIKVGSGDWSDSIVLETSLRDGVGFFGVTYVNSKLHGESIPNTQMALYVLPLLANILQAVDADLAVSIQVRIEQLKDAVERQWNPKGWYNRAILRNNLNQPKTLDFPNLEAQPWALISRTAGDHESTLVENIDALLDRPSPIGASLVVGGMTWPAVSQLLTWGYARCNRGQLAWRSLNRHTFAMHSHIYPNVWFNTWSGPDGINHASAAQPGGTWASPLTPMTDFPVMNANQDAMMLLGLLRVCGIEPAPKGDGLLIQPCVPRERFTLDTPLLRLQVEPGRIRVDYRAIVTGSRIFYVHVPTNTAQISVTVDGQPQTVERSADHVVVRITFTQNQTTQFTVTWTS